ncbi:MAG: cell division protein ZipA [Gammaproteobacteria bacterium]
MDSSAKLILYFLGALVITGYFIRRKRHKQRTDFFKDDVEPTVLNDESLVLPPSKSKNKEWDLVPEVDLFAPDNTSHTAPTNNHEAHAIAVDEAASSLSGAATFYHQPSQPTEKKQSPAEAPQSNILVMFLMAKPGRRFAGYELLQALIATGLRFGKMDIFHRHEGSNGTGPILFSVASATQPGTFDMSRMGTFACPGLTLFMDINSTAIPRIAFESLLKAAHQLAEDLDGELLDGQRQPWTSAHEESCWHAVNHCEQEQMSLDLPVE